MHIEENEILFINYQVLLMKVLFDPNKYMSKEFATNLNSKPYFFNMMM